VEVLAACGVLARDALIGEELQDVDVLLGGFTTRPGELLVDRVGAVVVALAAVEDAARGLVEWTVDMTILLSRVVVFRRRRAGVNQRDGVAYSPGNMAGFQGWQRGEKKRGEATPMDVVPVACRPRVVLPSLQGRKSTTLQALGPVHPSM
jgi:hypothetical protein